MAGTNFDPPNMKPKSFWKRPEGVAGLLVLLGLIGGAGFLIATNLPAIIAAMGNVLVLSATILAIGALAYMVLDPKMRALVGYMYKSVMRKITSWFITIDPIGILENYVDDLSDNLRKMGKQIGNIRGQMRKLKTLIQDNDEEMTQNLRVAQKAKEKGIQNQMVLASRKAARLKETNQKYAALLSKMEILYRVLTKMYQNSEILLEDTKDQVKLKKEERKAIRASHSAMKSAMSVISGDSDKRQMFDAALEEIADDVANKVGEMEQFMEMSSNFMESVDLQNGIFEEEGLKMLEQWEKKSVLMLMGDKSTDESLDLNSPQKQAEYRGSKEEGGYQNLFE